MEKTFYLVRFKLFGYTNTNTFLFKCQTSAFALSEGLNFLLKCVPNPIIESVHIEEIYNECELPY